MKNLIKRYENNPVIKPGDLPIGCFAVYNGGAVKIGERYIIMARVEDTARRQYAWTFRSSDGYNFTPDPEPVKFVADDMEKYQKFASHSWYDPRINIINDKYYITYAAMNHTYGCRIGIGETADFKTVNHISFPHHVQNRNAVLFPEKINGMYLMLHRPEKNEHGNCIWISRSPDLKFWGDCEPVIDNSKNLWDGIKIGAGAPPIKTDKGWLILTHAVCGSCAGQFYSVGAALLDLKNPYELIGRTSGMIMRPEAWYEVTGYVPNIIFPTGAIPEKNGKLKIYYGAADNYECLATADLNDLLNACAGSTFNPHK
jgi:predicted GH43/DUF377 family glycosyl hydrolase